MSAQPTPVERALGSVAARLGIEITNTELARAELREAREELARMQEALSRAREETASLRQRILTYEPERPGGSLP